jgi:hypothetical protein
MSAQIPEVLLYEGNRVPMCTEPLSVLLATLTGASRFRPTSTALCRGYIGTWEVSDNRLFLIELTGQLADGTIASVRTLFPEAQGPVFATWYSGTIRVPRGKMLKYVHMSYRSIYEEDLLFDVVEGSVRELTVRHNGTSLMPGEAGPYLVAGMTALTASSPDENDDDFEIPDFLRE